MNLPRVSVCAVGLFLASTVLAAGQSLDLPAEKFPGGKPDTMLKTYWAQQVAQAAQRWQSEYEARTKPEHITAHQAQLRAKFLAAIGGLPERTPLNPRVTGKLVRDGHRVEKILFESQPAHFVSALLFLPDAARFPPPYPGVLVPCGHALKAKGHDEYQTMGALLALNGMAALVYDPIDQGERGQYLGSGGWPKLWGTTAHFLVGIGSTLLGRNTARFEIWDGMRAIDYLQSRPEIDPQRIGCTGNSGGGTQTSYLMALDERVRAASPSCYLCGFPALLRTIGPQDAEQCIFGQLAFGLDHTDYVTLRAPSPVLICAATKDFFDIGGAWDTFRLAKRCYTRLGFAERVDLLENDVGHNYNKTQREGVARWMSRWLLSKDQPVTEPSIPLLSEQEYQCAPNGQVMSLPGARSVYDLNIEYENQLAPRRAEAWKSTARGPLLAKVRQLAGIRPLADLPRPEVEKLGTVTRTGCRIEMLLLKLEPGLVLPVLQFVPEQPQPNQFVLYVHDQGKAADAAPGGVIEQLLKEGRTVLAVDLCGTGQTEPADAEWKEAYTAYLLGRSYVGLRAEDVLQAARFLNLQATAGPPAQIRLLAVGRVGIPALHAAALEPQLFQAVKLTRTLSSWSGVIHSRLTQVQATQIVHGALPAYDLPDLAAILGAKLTVEQPVDGKN